MLHLIFLTSERVFTGCREFSNEPLFHEGENRSGPGSLMIVVLIEYRDAGMLKCADQEQQSPAFVDRERINRFQIPAMGEKFPGMSDGFTIKKGRNGCIGNALVSPAGHPDPFAALTCCSRR